MADDIKKRIVIEGDASGFEQAIDKVSNSGSALYERLKNEAKAYSNSLTEQNRYIEKELNKQQKSNIYQNQSNQLDLQKNREKDLQGLTYKSDIEKVNDNYDKWGNQNKSEFLSSRQEIIEAQMARDEEYNSHKLKEDRDRIKSEKEEQRDRARESRDKHYEETSHITDNIGNAGRKGIGFASRLASTVGVGLGIGAGFGLFSIIKDLIEGANKLEISYKSLNQVMKGVSQNNYGAAESIGKTTSKMNELAKSVVMESGGYGGEKSIGYKTHDVAFFAKGMGVQEQQLTALGETSRIGGANMFQELLRLTREMNRTGTITKDNTSLTAEKIEFWSRLNSMQAQRFGEVNPGASSMVLSAFQEANLPIMSDQRQMELIEKMDNAIRNPNNEYKQAYTFSVLNKGNLLETNIQQEKGIFDPENIKAVL